MIIIYYIILDYVHVGMLCEVFTKKTDANTVNLRLKLEFMAYDKLEILFLGLSEQWRQNNQKQKRFANDGK